MSARLFVRCVLLALCATAGLGCPGRLDDPERFEITQTILEGDAGCGPTVPTDIFQPTCGAAGCHTATTRAGGLDLVSDGVASRLVNQPSSTCSGRVLVTGPGSGFLFEKLQGNPECGFPMPFGKPALSSDQIACIAAWVSLQMDAGVGP